MLINQLQPAPPLALIENRKIRYEINFSSKNTAQLSSMAGTPPSAAFTFPHAIVPPPPFSSLVYL